MTSQKNVLVTGGVGYIGSHTVVELIQKGWNPIIVDDFRCSKKSALAGIERIIGARPTCIEIDICDLSALKSIFEKYDFNHIIHFAAYKAVGESVENPLMYYQNNLIGLTNILSLAEKFEVENFVFSSSCTVYGEPDEVVVTEETPTKEANSPYGATKQMGERILQDVAQASKILKVLNLRYFNPIGAHKTGEIGELPNGRPNNLLPYVTQVAVGKLDCLSVHGNDYPTEDGTCVRDYIHVCDVADAHVVGLNWLESQPTNTIENLNIGTGKGTSVLEIIHIFERVTGISLNWRFGPRRDGDVVAIYADASKVEKVMGWKAQFTVEDAIRDTWNWEQKLKNA